MTSLLLAVFTPLLLAAASRLFAVDDTFVISMKWLTDFTRISSPSFVSFSILHTAS